MVHASGLRGGLPVEGQILGTFLDSLAGAGDAPRWSTLVDDHRLAQVRGQSLAYLRQQEVGGVDLYRADMAGGRRAVRHNKCQRIPQGYPFGSVADENPCFGHAPRRQPVLVYFHPGRLETEGMIFAETYRLDSLAYTLCPRGRDNQQRNLAPARLTDLVGDQEPVLLQTMPLATSYFAHSLHPFRMPSEVVVLSDCLLSVDRWLLA